MVPFSLSMAPEILSPIVAFLFWWWTGLVVVVVVV